MRVDAGWVQDADGVWDVRKGEKDVVTMAESREILWAGEHVYVTYLHLVTRYLYKI